jgi:hypothetical protein
MVSNYDIIDKVQYKNLKISQYKDLYEVKNLLKLLPNKKLSFLVILINTEAGGHWVLLVRTGNLLSYFDSYGYKPDSELQLIPQNVKQEFHENNNLSVLISELLSQGFQLTYNKHPFQKFGNEVNTCGKYVVFICNCFLKGYNLQQATKYLYDLSKNLHKSPDEIVNLYYNGNLNIEDHDLTNNNFSGGILKM